MDCFKVTLADASNRFGVSSLGMLGNHADARFVAMKADGFLVECIAINQIIWYFSRGRGIKPLQCALMTR